MIPLKRLMKEYKEMMKNPSPGVLAGPTDEDNYFQWEAYIMGPEDTPYEFGVFKAILSFPKDYPHNPPELKFVTPLFHPNIYKDGKVCISILHPPGDDPVGYELACERWSPVQSIDKVLLSIISMLAEPNVDSPANIDAAKLYRDNNQEFINLARACARKSIGY
eukprot:m.5157 g.5157  ORF g.5157 m.5157 type:complete len:164 (-) comp2348_c0_seq1:233-724(-)